MRMKGKEIMNSSVVGIDLGEKESVATYLLPDGTEKDQFSFTMNVDGYKAFSEKIPKGVRITFESSGSAYSVDRNIRNLGYYDITVAHPKDLSWIIKSKKKNDHVDSVKLAKLHLVDMIPELSIAVNFFPITPVEYFPPIFRFSSIFISPRS